MSRVETEDVAQVAAEDARRLGILGAGNLDGHRVVLELRQAQFARQQPAVGVGVRTHAPVARREPVDDVRTRSAVVVEELADRVGPHPPLELREVLGFLAHFRERHLVRAPRALDGEAVDDLRAGPALRCSQHDHRPTRPPALAPRTGPLLYRADRDEHVIERRRELLVDTRGVVAGDEIRLPPAALEQRGELGLRDTREHGRVRDLVAVQVQDRQDRAVTDRVEELVRVPARRERAGLGFAVADDTRDDQIGVVERGAEGVADRVPELATFVDRARRLGCDVTGNATGERELLEEPFHPLGVTRDRGVRVGVAALEPRVGEDRGAAVSGTDHVDHVEVVARDHAGEVPVQEVQARARAPVAEQARFHVGNRERLAQQRVAHQIDLADGQVVRRPPVRVEAGELLSGQG